MRRILWLAGMCGFIGLNFCARAPAQITALQGEYPIALDFRDHSKTILGQQGRKNKAALKEGSDEALTPEILAAYGTETGGILTKMLPDIGRNTPGFGQALGRALPHALLLEHLLFASVNRSLAQEIGFSPGHFAYYEGSAATKTFAPGDTEIEVQDGGKFRQGDLVVIVPTLAGARNWARSEWAAVTGVAQNRLTLQRGVYGSKTFDPAALPHDQVWLAPGLHPYRPELREKTHFAYNWSTHCPKDAAGRQAADVLAAALGKMFTPGGELDQIDGLAWDVPATEFRKTDGRAVDADGDGRGDDGIFEQVNTYALGAVQLNQKIRAAIGKDKIFLSDGYYGDVEEPRLQLPDVFSGIEHDINRDHHLREASSFLNVFGFYQKYVAGPGFDLVVRKDKNVGRKEEMSPEQLRHNQLMKNAFATVLGVAYTALNFPNAEPGKSFSAADETRDGRADRLFWLGHPTGPVLRPGVTGPDIPGDGGDPSLLPRLQSSNALLSRDGGTVSVKPREGQTGDSLALELPDIPLSKGAGLMVQFEVKGEKLADFPDIVPRVVTLLPLDYPGWFAGKKRAPVTLLGWAVARDFTTLRFFLPPALAEGKTTLSIGIQGVAPASVRNLSLRPAQAAFARVFEHGLVLCNLSETQPFTFDLARLAPGASPRRISGSPFDRFMAKVNTGEPAGTSVTLEPQSGLFLEK